MKVIGDALNGDGKSIQHNKFINPSPNMESINQNKPTWGFYDQVYDRDILIRLIKQIPCHYLLLWKCLIEYSTIICFYWFPFCLVQLNYDLWIFIGCSVKSIEHNYVKTVVPTISGLLYKPKQINMRFFWSIL